MDDTHLDGDFPPLTIDQMLELAAAVHEDFGGNLSRAAFIESLLMLLEDVPGVEVSEVAPSLIESAWNEYAGRRP